jgi:hypothetical protein
MMLFLLKNLIISNLLIDNIIFPNKNVSINWNNSSKYDINLSIVDSNWNQLYNMRIGSDLSSPFIWNVPNLINKYTYFNKKLLFIQNNNIIDEKNINNYGVLLNQDNTKFELRTNYDCEYFNFSFNKTNNLSVYNELFYLNSSYFGIYDVTITSNDLNLLVYEILNISIIDDDDSNWTIFTIILLILAGISGLLASFMILMLIVYFIHRVFGINLLGLKILTRRRKRRSAIHPQLSHVLKKNKNKLRRRNSTTDNRRYSSPDYYSNELSNYNLRYESNAYPPQTNIRSNNLQSFTTKNYYNNNTSNTNNNNTRNLNNNTRNLNNNTSNTNNNNTRYLNNFSNYQSDNEDDNYIYNHELRTYRECSSTESNNSVFL